MREFDSKGLELCKAQAKLFERSIEEFDGSSSNFIKVFMRSNAVKLTDRHGFFDSAYIFSSLNDNTPSVNTRGTTKYGPAEMYWIGYIYRYWAYTYRWPSKKIYSIIQGSELYSLYNPYHCLDPAQAIQRIMEAKNIKYEDPLTILKRIYQM